MRHSLIRQVKDLLQFINDGTSARMYGPELRSVTDVPGGVQVELTVTIDTEGGTKPVCVAETVSRLYV